MNQIDLHYLHNVLLRKLPFTISGNISAESLIFDFLKSVAESHLLGDNNDIKFIMGGYSKIKFNNLNEIFEPQKWKTDRLNSFFYYDYENDGVEKTITIYQYFLKKLFTNQNKPYRNITNIICDNNHSGNNFRVKIVKTKSKKIRLLYNIRERVIEAIIPMNFFNPHFLIDEIDDLDSDLIVRGTKNNYQYFRKQKLVNDEANEENKKEELLKRIFSDATYKNLTDPINCFTKIDVDKLSNHLNLNFVDEKNADSINEILYLFLTAGLLSFLLGMCSIEYFVSVANNVKSKKLSVGSIAVGYHSDHLDKNYRALFNILTNHIAANLASQLLLDYNMAQEFTDIRMNQLDFLKRFKEYYGLRQSNGEDIHDEERSKAISQNSDKNICEFLDDNDYSTKLINNWFGTGFNDYLSKILSAERIDYGMYQSVHTNQSSHIDTCKKINLFYQKLNLDEYSKTTKGLTIKKKHYNLNSTADSDNNALVNIYLPHMLIEHIKNEHKENCTIKCKCVDNKILIDVHYNSDIPVPSLIVKLSEYHKTENNKGNFSSFLISNYNAIRAVGDLKIYDGNERFSLSLKNDFKVKLESNNGIFEYIGSSADLVPTSHLIYELTYQLY